MLDKAIEQVESEKLLFKDIVNAIEKGKKDIYQELKSYPERLESIREFKDTKEDMISELKHFENIKDDLKRVIIQGVNIEKKH